MTEKLTFELWMREVDKALERIVGLSSADLPDVCYRDLYDDGAGPREAARIAVRNGEL
jgi:hypothetical protein